MFAIFQTGGKQYKVQQGEKIYVEKLDLEVGAKIKFDEVIMVEGKIGTPFVKGASIEASVVKNGKQRKIHIIKFKSKKHHMKRQGHRQPYTQLVIDAINVK
ncbi:50S ribosomal protein L21 [Ureaplasma diversum]|uniref:Large ribosomal subunit protein bL21 n=2 Tax=Ureaplasma diversum TaxID=42094 RepID=A0A084EYH2_9BACT|nr:50S ribosomal protein L21 [Ureaplasma diversum]AJQ45413.1 50S ribosomal protein L21 [Ureaplasma diversum]KEZ23014.1 50S ribosomal protein L21 [Ureaplasma diversum NCTC 246]